MHLTLEIEVILMNLPSLPTPPTRFLPRARFIIKLKVLEIECDSSSSGVASEYRVI